MISFDPYFAKQFGLHESIVFERIKTLVLMNMHNYQNFYQDKFWADLNIHVINNFLFFLTNGDIDFAIDNLLKRKVLIQKNVDNVSWYAISEKYFDHTMLK